MKTKVLEVRDSGTFIPVLAMRWESENEAQRWLGSRVGFVDGSNIIVVMRLNDQEAHADVYDWPENPRTMRDAANHIQDHFDELKDGDVVDVEFIYGMTKTPKVSARTLTEDLPFKCPECWRESWNSNDLKHGWCANCKRQTAPEKSA